MHSVATAIGHVTGPFNIISSNKDLIFTNLRLNSKPQPLDNRKSTNIFPSISTIFALKTKGIFLLSTPDIVIYKKIIIQIIYNFN